MPQAKKRYAQVGLGARSWMYTGAIFGKYSNCCELVGFCDKNQGRMDLVNRRNAESPSAPVPTFKADEFDRMIAETKPDAVIVTSGPDATHSDYICRALEFGCDVITEKPMTIDEVSCRKILQAVADTGRKCQVTFNYRYSPHRSQIKEMLDAGEIGEILSVDFTWLLDTRHGADYFRRWHRRRENSGSLLVHKATHHFDLVNWWIEDVPENVFCHASRRFYTPAMGDEMGLAGRGERCLDCPVKDECRFYLDLPGNKNLKSAYLDNENEDGYFRDRCIFSDEIDIWDNMSVSARYRGGAILNYFLHAYSPWEGYQIAFNGTKGRLEHRCCENTYISGDGTVPGELARGKTKITLIRSFSEAQAIEPRTAEGGHGGGDPVLLADIFAPDPPADPLHRKANQHDGAYSILVGIAAYHSIDTGKAVGIDDLLAGAPVGERW